MSAIPLSGFALAAVKKALRKEYPDVRSSHLSEAVAAALRRRTHAALLTDIARYPDDDAPIELLDDALFDQRLQELGYPPDPEFSFELLDDTGAIPTLDPHAWDISYRTTREKAWRNLMVCAINAALSQKLFSLRLDDNRWPDQEHGHLFDFTLPNGLPGRGYVYDIGFGELAINAAVNPKGDWVKAGNAGFHAGDAFAIGWLERRKGAWLQSAQNMFNCRRALLQPLAGMEVQPMGYGDHGRVIM